MLEISGVADVRTHYWDSYNSRKDLILSKQVENMNNNFLDSHIFNKEEKDEIKQSMNGKDLSSVSPANSKKKSDKDVQVDPQLYNVAEEFIVNHIPDELVSVL